MEYGLKNEILSSLSIVFSKIKNIEKVILYGSRAKGNFTNGSDIDITLLGKNLSLNNSIYPLMEAIEELYLPYTIDISIFSQIENTALTEHIKLCGKTLYSQKEK